jgi:hypothetical protein
MGTKMADYGVAGLENPDFPHCEKGLYYWVMEYLPPLKVLKLNFRLGNAKFDRCTL